MNKTDSVAASPLLWSRASFLMLLWKPSLARAAVCLASREQAGGETDQERSGTEYSIKADLSKEIAAEIPTADKPASPR